jgi:hypothetical protein
VENAKMNGEQLQFQQVLVFFSIWVYLIWLEKRFNK